MKIPESGTMEDGPNSAPHNGQLGPSGVGTSSSSVKANNNDDNNPRTQYSIPGILHFIQHEWARFEMERSQWEVDRAELQVTTIRRFFAFYFMICLQPTDASECSLVGGVLCEVAECRTGSSKSS